jgi:TRAP-type C4-dicarboxylate transport system substrate-binding protein
MTLADVLPAIQQGAIDGADSALNVYVILNLVPRLDGIPIDSLCPINR